MSLALLSLQECTRKTERAAEGITRSGTINRLDDAGLLSAAAQDKEGEDTDAPNEKSEGARFGNDFG